MEPVPHIPDIPLILNRSCVPAAGDCNKRAWMTRGQCSEMSSNWPPQLPYCLTVSHLVWPGLTVSPTTHIFDNRSQLFKHQKLRSAQSFGDQLLTAFYEILIFLFKMPCLHFISVMWSPNMSLTVTYTCCTYTGSLCAPCKSAVFCSITSLLKVEEQLALSED